MADCLFCKIANKEIPAGLVYEDDRAVAFKDINPQAPHHLLVIPRMHLESVNSADAAHAALLGHLFTVSAQLAHQLGFAERGYRCVVNTNREAGQTVFHLHLHLLGGRQFTWPPG